jgi:hypothetical protein
VSYANARVQSHAAENNADLRAWRGYLKVMNLIPHKHAAFIRNQKGGMKSLESQANNQTLSWTLLGRMMFSAAMSGLCSNQNGYPAILFGKIIFFSFSSGHFCGTELAPIQSAMGTAVSTESLLSWGPISTLL